MGLDVALTMLLLPASTWAFQPGAVCVGANYSEPARGLLVGKHLILKDSPWFPFAIKDASKPHGWDGLDVDLVSAVAAKLGFTFEILEMTPTPGETWTRMLFEEVDRADLMLSYWAHTTERLDRVAMLIAKGVRVVQLADFVGVFIVWGATSLIVLVWRWLGQRRNRDACAKGRCCRRVSRIAPHAGRLRNAPLRRIPHPHIPAQLARLRLSRIGSPQQPDGELRMVRAATKAISAVRAMKDIQDEDRAAGLRGVQGDPFDFSKVNPNDVNGMVYRVMHQLGEMRNEMRQMKRERLADDA